MTVEQELLALLEVQGRIKMAHDRGARTTTEGEVMSRYTIRYRPDGDGFWYEVRDDHRRFVSSAWRAGKKRYAQDEARSVVERDRLARQVAYELGGVRLEQPAVPRSRTAPIPEPCRLPADVCDTIVVDVEEAQR